MTKISGLVKVSVLVFGLTLAVTALADLAPCVPFPFPHPGDDPRAFAAAVGASHLTQYQMKQNASDCEAQADLFKGLKDEASKTQRAYLGDQAALWGYAMNKKVEILDDRDRQKARDQARDQYCHQSSVLNSSDPTVNGYCPNNPRSDNR